MSNVKLGILTMLLSCFWAVLGGVTGMWLKDTEVRALEALISDPGSAVIEGKEYPAICVLPETLYMDRNKDKVTLLMLNCEGGVEQWVAPHPHGIPVLEEINVWRL